MQLQEIQSMFVDATNNYRFARWGRAIAPVMFGVDDATVNVFRDAVKALCVAANHPITDVDPELGSNLMFFFCADWQELLDLPNLDQMIPDLQGRVKNLIDAKANQYRMFRFDDQGAISACFVFLRMDDALANQAADDLALDQMTRVMLTWGPKAWAQQSPLVQAGGQGALRPDIATLLRAAYDPVMPACANDNSHALRLMARMGTA